MSPGVSAIVVTYHTGPRLKECLYALLGDPEVDEIIIVDNGNPGPVRTWLQAFEQKHPAITLLSPPGNLGFGKAVNVGAASATQGQFLVINPDAVLRQRSICHLQDAATDLVTPWIIGGRIFDETGREERGPRRRQLTIWRAITTYLGWNTWTLETTPPPSGPIDMPVISGAFFLTDRASFDQLGGFDERYFLHVEDVDLCERCRKLGGRVIYDPRAGALHYGATSDVPSKVVARHKGDSLRLYLRTHARNPVERFVAWMVMPLIRAASMFKAR